MVHSKLMQLGPSNGIVDNLDSDDDKFGWWLQSDLKSNNEFGFRLNDDFD